MVDTKLPTEQQVRRALLREVSTSDGPNGLFVDEFWVPVTKERADLVHLDESLHAYEIKTARDSLKRLPRQADAYARLFSRCTAVVDARHVDQACKMLPTWWAVWTVSGGRRLTFQIVREGGPNPETDVNVLVRLLWREEVREALQSFGIEAEGRSTRAAMWNTLMDCVRDSQHLMEIVCEFLTRRQLQLAGT